MDSALGKKVSSRWTFGPSAVFALAVLSSGDIVANAAAGGSYGYSLIWALALALMGRFVLLDVSAKYVLVTGETLLQGYSRAGNWVVWAVFAMVVLRRFVANMAVISLMGRGANLVLPLPGESGAAWWSGIFIALGLPMLVWGGYRVIEPFCKALIAAMTVSLAAAAIASRPDWGAAAQGLLLPSAPVSVGDWGVFLVIASIVGAEIGSTGNLTYTYFVEEKGWSGTEMLRKQRLDLALGVGALFLMGALMQIAAAATIGPLGIVLKDENDLVRVFSSTQGLFGILVFGLGLWGATFSSYVGGTAGYGYVAADIWRRFGPGGDRGAAAGNWSGDRSYRVYVLIQALGPAFVLFTGWYPVALVLAASAMSVLILPMTSFALIRITNDRALMGKYRNSALTNILLAGIALGILGLSSKTVWVWLRP